MPIKTLAGYSSAIAALTIAGLVAYVALTSRVATVEANALGPVAVEHLIELKTADKLEAIQASLLRIENNIARLQTTQPVR